MNLQKITTINFATISDWTMKKSIKKKRVLTKMKTTSMVLVWQNQKNDQIGYLYVADIEFDHTKATEK